MTATAATGRADPPAPQVAVGAVAVRDGRLLMVRRGRPPGVGLWSVSGGRVEPGETLPEAVVREVAEETGLAVTVGAALGHVERRGDHPEPYHFVILDFAVEIVGDPTPRAGDDADDVAWVPFAELVGSTHRRAVVAGLVEFLVGVGVLDGGDPTDDA